ncbi:MAG: patatin-like phospholipase family protein [Bacillota bacterium]
MARRAVVLGGGGTLGIAWMTGLAAAMAEGGIQLSDADLFVGTSAGSVVGTQLAFSLDPKLMLAAQQAEGDKPSGLDQHTDPATVTAVLEKWFTAQTVTPELRRELGAIALVARTMDEERWLGVFTKTLGGVPWPAKPLKITAVDAVSGELTVWESGSNVELPKAVASSCTVPGLFPPVTINGHRYIDGGVRSGTNADLAAGYEKVLVIAPMASVGHPLGHRQLIAEMERLRAAGAQVEPVLPDREALEVFGPSMMDATRRTASLEAGLRQGRTAADHLTAFWH